MCAAQYRYLPASALENLLDGFMDGFILVFRKPKPNWLSIFH